MNDVENIEEKKINYNGDSSLELIEIYKKLEEYLDYLNKNIIEEKEED